MPRSEYQRRASISFGRRSGRSSRVGAGKRLFDHLGTEPIELERTRIVEVPEGVTHLRFRIRR